MKAPKISVFALIVVLVSIAISAFSLSYPLLGALGSESGIVFGLFVGPLMYLGGAVRGAYRDPRGFGSDFLHECLTGLVALCIVVGTLVTNSYFVESCAPARGILPFLTHAIPVVLLNCTLGLLIGRVIAHRFVAFIAALVVAAGYILARAYVWWLDPSFRVLAHPLIAVDGDLMSGAGLSLPILGFRAATLCFAFALIFLGVALFSHNRDRFLKTNPFKASSLFPVATFLLLGAILHFSVADAFIFGKSDREAELSRVYSRGQFHVHVNPQNTTGKMAHAILAEANLWGKRLEHRLGKSGSEPIHIWLYSNTEALEKFTGASHVHFALPAHREIHITNVGVPHPTLGHELAHIYIGERTTTFLGIPGTLGFVTNQGLTEGLAVMLTEELSIKRELTIQEQSAALLKIGYMPDLDQLFSLSPLSFFAHNPQISYSLAGTYLKALLEQSDNDAKRQQIIAQLAASGRIDAAFTSDKEKAEFDVRFINTLRAMELPSDAIASMSEAYRSKSILTKTCEDTAPMRPAIDNFSLAAEELLRRAQLPHDPVSLQVQSLLNEAGDLFWKDGDSLSAANAWSEMQPSLFPPSERRTILLKQMLSSLLDSKSFAHVLDYIVFANDLDLTKTIASVINLAIQSERQEQSVFGNYLMLRARVIAHPNPADHAALASLSAEPLLPLEFQIESLRLLAMGKALGDEAGSAAALFNQVGELSKREATTLTMRDYAERSEYIAFALSLSLNDEVRNDTYLFGLERHSDKNPL